VPLLDLLLRKVHGKSDPGAGFAPASPVEKTAIVLRNLVLTAYLLGVGGAAAELMLIRHVDGLWQTIPLALIGLSIATLVLLWGWPGRMTLMAFRGSMFLFLVSGVLGLYLHFDANIEWVEEDPSLSGAKLLWEALIRGKNPPVLAPGAMIQFAILGLAYTYRYPASGTIKVEQAIT
jgi:hypothetical protein